MLVYCTSPFQILGIMHLSFQLSVVQLVIEHSRVTRWLSGRVLDSRSRDCRFEPHRSHCVVPLSKTLYPLLSTGST